MICQILDATNLISPTAEMRSPSFLPLLFSHLSPAYFSPSVPSRLLDGFLSHGGHVLRCSSATVTDPLDLPASYFFVTTFDPLIPHLSKRPVVLFNADWVAECLRRGEVTELGDWIILSRPGGGSENMSSMPYSRQQQGSEREESGSSAEEGQVATPDSPTRSLNNHSRQGQFLAPRLLLDFDRNTVINLLGEGEGDIMAKLNLPRPWETHDPTSRTVVSDRSTKTEGHQHLTQMPRSFLPPLLTTSPADDRVSVDEMNVRYVATKNLGRKNGQNVLSSSVRCNPPSSGPPRYMLNEVMEVLNRLNGISDIEVVRGVVWRVKRGREGGDADREG